MPAAGLKGGREKSKCLQAIAAYLVVPANVADLLAKAPAAAAELAERAAVQWAYVEGRGYGFDDRTPAGWLANRGLLASADWYRLVMPSEVGLALRGGHVFEEFWPDEPGLGAEAVDAGAVDAAGSEAALAVVADLAAIVECWDAEPPALLKDGGVRVRDLRRAASGRWPGCSTSRRSPAWPGPTTGSGWRCRGRPSTSGSASPPPPGGPG